MDTIINWFRGLPRNIQITLMLAVGVFTPIVSIVFTLFFAGVSGAFSIIGFVLGALDWKGVLFFLVIGIFFAAKAGYNFIENYEVEDTYIEEDTSWDPFR